MSGASACREYIQAHDCFATMLQLFLVINNHIAGIVCRLSIAALLICFVNVLGSAAITHNYPNQTDIYGTARDSCPRQRHPCKTHMPSKYVEHVKSVVRGMALRLQSTAIACI